VVRVDLVALSDVEREEFIREDIAGYAEQLAADEAVSPEEAQRRAQTEFGPRLRHEHASAVANGHQRWTALAADGTSVGWLWVTPPAADMPGASAFLYQILVKPVSRRKGYGRAMLAALEQLLAADGIVEMRLNVFDTNQRAQSLYASVGYELVTPLDGMSQLRKRIAVKDHDQ
jgi:ribosomal protein S18 acetylase RimI-like enzyme